MALSNTLEEESGCSPLLPHEKEEVANKYAEVMTGLPVDEIKELSDEKLVEFDKEVQSELFNMAVELKNKIFGGTK